MLSMFFCGRCQKVFKGRLPREISIINLNGGRWLRANKELATWGGGNQTMEVNKGLDSACLMPRNNSFGELQGYLKI